MGKNTSEYLKTVKECDATSSRGPDDAGLFPAVRSFHIHSLGIVSGGFKAMATFVFSRCRNIENLHLTQGPEHDKDLFSVVKDLPLKRLHCHLGPFFGTAPQIDFTHRLFAGITHLQLLDARMDLYTETWFNLALIPHLTHISFFTRDLTLSCYA
ncbi:hypothetical protein B0H19DRAFT_1067783 [Mycena capillaripes]|nr:hypothetical protein B0H19DRAFT_1067783 [Mycena capillaripes]